MALRDGCDDGSAIGSNRSFERFCGPWVQAPARGLRLDEWAFAAFPLPQLPPDAYHYRLSPMANVPP
ncbi:MAG TPA: hypothetical protein PKZ76_16750 [Xanthomonadaceae bacterium]|nr:hypothetical protein [Xanthomonadaceae bacterium]